jgi:hypothetical protein
MASQGQVETSPLKFLYLFISDRYNRQIGIHKIQILFLVFCQNFQFSPFFSSFFFVFAFSLFLNLSLWGAFFVHLYLLLSIKLKFKFKNSNFPRSDEVGVFLSASQSALARVIALCWHLVWATKILRGGCLRTQPLLIL